MKLRAKFPQMNKKVELINNRRPGSCLLLGGDWDKEKGNMNTNRQMFDLFDKDDYKQGYSFFGYEVQMTVMKALGFKV